MLQSEIFAATAPSGRRVDRVSPVDTAEGHAWDELGDGRPVGADNDCQRLRVSVVIPAYRAATTLRRAIESVLAQTYAADEIIVVDDGSPEDLAAVVAPYGSAVTLVRQSNQGAAAARNHGIARCRGDLVAFLDADDFWNAEKLARCVQPFVHSPEVGLVASQYILQDELGNDSRIAGPSAPQCNRSLQAGPSELLDFARQISTPTVVVRRSLLANHVFDTTLTTAEDRDLWIRLLQATHVFLIDQPLCRVSFSESSLSHANIDLDSRCMLAVIDRHAGAMGPRIARRERASVYYRWAVGSPSRRQAIKAWWRSVLLWPFPFPRSQVRVPWARVRTLVAILRRGFV